jgi:hypothetical protein
LHIQAEDAIEDERYVMGKQEKEISKLAKNLPVPSKTVIKTKILLNKSRIWQDPRLPHPWPWVLVELER